MSGKSAGCAPANERLVLVHLHPRRSLDRLTHTLRNVVHHHQMPNRLERGQQRAQQRHQRVVEKDHLVFGMVHDVGDLFREQAQVDGVQHPARARGGEVQLEMTGGVPGEGADPAVGRDAQQIEHRDRPGGCARPRLRRWCVRFPVGVAVTISLRGWNSSARWKRWVMLSGTSCMSPCMN